MSGSHSGNKVILGYNIIKFLGRGGYGKVYLVTNAKGDYFVAKMQEIDDEASLLLEAFMFKQLNQLNDVVPVFVELIFEPKYITMITKFVGNSLDKLTQKQQLQPQTLLDMFK